MLQNVCAVMAPSAPRTTKNKPSNIGGQKWFSPVVPKLSKGTINLENLDKVPSLKSSDRPETGWWNALRKKVGASRDNTKLRTIQPGKAIDDLKEDISKTNKVNKNLQ